MGKLLRYDNHEITLINDSGREVTGRRKNKCLNFMRHQQRQKWEKEQRELARNAIRVRKKYRNLRAKYGELNADIWAYRQLNATYGGYCVGNARVKQLKDEYDAGLI